MASASVLSHLVFWPWTAFMAQAWPRTKGIFSSRQVSASQCRPAAVHALAGDEEAVAEGSDGAEEGVGVGGQVPGEPDLAVVVEDDDEEGPGVQVDAGVESDAGRRGEGTHGEDLLGLQGAAKCHTHDRRKAFMSIQALQPTGAALRALP